jgi:predicted esterase
MPPVLMFHGDTDPVVPYRHAVALDRALRATGNDCVFITIPGGGHGIGSEEWKQKSREHLRRFLAGRQLLPVGP